MSENEIIDQEDKRARELLLHLNDRVGDYILLAKGMDYQYVQAGSETIEYLLSRGYEDIG